MSNITAERVEADSGNWVACAKVDEVPEGAMKGVTLDGKRVLVARLQGRFYAIDGVCSHLAGDLTKGTLNGTCVTCPVHHAQYDVRTGKVVKNVGRMIKLATRKEATGQRTIEAKEAGPDILLKRQPQL
jgi:3-phenylpropionate/trans-cinnamate dioxygenase ferredoxin component